MDRQTDGGTRFTQKLKEGKRSFETISEIYCIMALYQIWILGVIWTAMVIIFTIFQNYPSCTSNIAWMQTLLTILTTIFIIDTVIIFMFLFSQTHKINKNIQNNKNPLENLCISYHKDDIEHRDHQRVFIIPVYLGLYSLFLVSFLV